jgi:hypothetical protein
VRRRHAALHGLLWTLGETLRVGWAVTRGSAFEAQATCMVATGLSSMFALLLWMNKARWPPLFGRPFGCAHQQVCSNWCQPALQRRKH